MKRLWVSPVYQQLYLQASFEPPIQSSSWLASAHHRRLPFRDWHFSKCWALLNWLCRTPPCWPRHSALQKQMPRVSITFAKLLCDTSLSTVIMWFFAAEVKTTTNNNTYIHWIPILLIVGLLVPYSLQGLASKFRKSFMLLKKNGIRKRQTGTKQ